MKELKTLIENINWISIIFSVGLLFLFNFIWYIYKLFDGKYVSKLDVKFNFGAFLFLMLMVMVLSACPNNKTNKNVNNNKIETNGKFDYIEREFNRQVKHQLQDMNIILIMDDKYSGESEDDFIEKKGNELNLELKNVVFYNKRVIYEFVPNYTIN